MKEIVKNKWFKFGLAGTAYLLWVIWNTNYWWLLGLPVVFDIYVSKKVHWAFWKKKGVQKQTKVVEWVDAIIFAVIAASFIRTFFFEAYTIPTSSMEKSLLVGDYLFVSKSAYGPRKPITPISFPFVHHSMPASNNMKPSFSEAWQRDYFRMAGYRTIKNNDVVVFNFPEGDTVCLENQAPSYYQLVRDYGRERIWNEYTVAHRPVDKCENYIKRCVAIPGDSLKIVNGQLYINNNPQEVAGKVQYRYAILTDGSSINPKALQKLGVSMEDFQQGYIQPGYYVIPLTEEVAKRISTFNIVKSIERVNAGTRDGSKYIFPHDARYAWNEDNFGPIWIPKEGATTPLTLENLPFYERIINHYEGNQLEVKDSVIYINGEAANSYTFAMDYYWMMGDNRHNSLDSRFWGYVPEDHVVGRASLVWLSLDKDYGFPKNIRFSRMLRTIH
ncbi:MAG: signal peptidase I [Salinivirgaceae bacterium]